MKKGLSIINANSTSKGPLHFHNRLKEEFEKLNISLDLKKGNEIFALVDEEGKVNNRLGKYDFILYLDKDLYTSLLLEKSGYRLFNSQASIALCDDKMLTHLALADGGIKMPKTIHGPLNYSGILDLMFLDNLEKELSYPLVSKSNFGSLGKQVYLISNREELIENEKKLLSSPRLYQSLIKSSFGFDYRLIVVGHKVVATMKRINESGDFRSNLALGGRGEKVSLPVSFIEAAEKATTILGLDYAGVDLLQGENGEPILCEVNSNAFLEGVEKVTGINIAAIYADYIAKSI